MADKLVVHPKTAGDLHHLVVDRPHAIILEGQKGIGKKSLALQMAAEITGKSDPLKALQEVLMIELGDENGISVEKIRLIERFLSRKLPGNGTRTVIVDDAHTMRQEAQNALLKTLEEPPDRTMIILLAANQTNILPTVRSRSLITTVKRPDPEQLRAFFIDEGYTTSSIEQSMLMSGALPGLMHALLDGDETHPLRAAASLARQIIQSSRFERLIIADKLSKQREEAIDVCTILGQMAHIKLVGGTETALWSKLLTESFRASEQLRLNTQPKLVVTDFMLSL